MRPKHTDRLEALIQKACDEKAGQMEGDNGSVISGRAR